MQRGRYPRRHVRRLELAKSALPDPDSLLYSYRLLVYVAVAAT
jgi:hypothetical protein